MYQQPEGAAGGSPLPRNLGDLHRVLKSLQKGQWHGMGGGGKKVKSLSLVRLFATPWTIARQAPLSMGFSRQEYWSGLPLGGGGRLLQKKKEKKGEASEDRVVMRQKHGDPGFRRTKWFKEQTGQPRGSLRKNGQLSTESNTGDPGALGRQKPACRK